MLTWWKAAKLGIALAAAAVVLSSCVSAGFVDFDTAQTLPPGHVGIRAGAEGPGPDEIPDVFAAIHVGLPLGTELGVRAGLGTLLASLKYHVPFVWKRAALAVGLTGGFNFSHEVKQLDVPVIFSYRFNKALAVTASQTTTAYVGNYSGFAISGGAGVKWNIGRFYLFPKVVVGYFAPGGGSWTAPGGCYGILGCSTLSIARQQAFGSLGLAMGFDF